MPTYGYRCEPCGQEFDVVQRMSDESVAACPVCGAPARRLFFPAGIVFKGSGFYKTDSRRVSGDGSGAAAPSSGKPAGTSSSDGGAGTGASTPTAAGATGD